MSVTREQFRAALGQFAASVTVVTVDCGDRLAGITVTAFCSVSLEPPLVLICIDKQAWLHDRLRPGGTLAVNVLSEAQESVSRRFASSAPDQFSGIPYVLGASGAPLLDGVLAAIECRVVEIFPGGDHTIFVGKVEATRIGEGKPLLYFRGCYQALA